MKIIRKLVFPFALGYALSWVLLTAVTWDVGTLAIGPEYRFYFLGLGVFPGLIFACYVDMSDVGLTEEEEEEKNEAFFRAPRKILEFLWRGGDA